MSGLVWLILVAFLPLSREQLYGDNTELKNRLKLMGLGTQFSVVSPPAVPSEYIQRIWEEPASLQKRKLLTFLQELCDEMKNLEILDMSPDCARGLNSFFCGLSQLGTSAALDCRNGTSPCHCQSEKSKRMRNNMWTVEAIDALAKLPPSMMEANALWLGEFNQCQDLAVTLENSEMLRGKYCIVSIGVPTKKPSDYCSKRGRSGGKYICEENPGSTHVGVCVPSSCSDSDVSALIRLLASSGLVKNCHQKVRCVEPWKLGAGLDAIFAILLCVVVGVLVVSASVYDTYLLQERKITSKTDDLAFEDRNSAAFLHNDGVEAENNGAVANFIVEETLEKQSKRNFLMKVLLTFSIPRNLQQLQVSESFNGDLPCLDGIRALSLAWVALGHVFYFSLPYIDNFSVVLQKSKGALFQIVSSATLASDSFFVLSGFLLSYHWLRRIQSARKEQVRSPNFWLSFYGHRLLRILPTYGVVLWLGASVWPLLGSGPLWAGHSQLEIRNCPRSWWTNLLFLNNFLKLDESCMGWTWYLANEIQFFLFAPLLLVLLLKNSLAGFLLGFYLIVVSAVTNALIVVDKLYPPALTLTTNPYLFVYSFPYVKDVFVKPYTRWSPYIIGALLGYVQLKTNQRYRLPQPWRLLLLAGSLSVLGAVTFGLHPFSKGEPVSAVALLLFAALARPAFALALATLIFLCLRGCRGLDNFFSFPLWKPLSRLTFCSALIHPFIPISFLTSLKRAEHATDFTLLYLFLATLVVAFGLSLLTYLAFEAPFLSLRDMCLNVDATRVQQRSGRCNVTSKCTASNVFQN